MSSGARGRILDALRQAPARDVPQRLPVPLPRQAGMETPELTAAFCQKFIDQTGIVYRLDPSEDPGVLMGRIFDEHGLCRAVAGNDAILAASGLVEAAASHGLSIRTQADFAGRREFTDAVFEEADAGITGADFGVAESGTLVLAFDSDHARLVSLAPNVHIALLPENRMVGTYEQALAGICRKGNIPSQVVFITGPSMTADIQGRPFKGMHGPQKVIVVLVNP
jgi:L-lactate dehydrogenase complex protein LldG